MNTLLANYGTIKADFRQFLTAHGQNRHVSISGLKSDITITCSVQRLRFPIKKHAYSRHLGLQE